MTDRYFVWKVYEPKEKRNKIAAFDMDHTLICPKEGRTFPKTKDDIEWWHKDIPNILQQLYKDGYHIVIFTNQSGIQRGKVKQSDVEWRINWIQENTGVPLSYYIAPYINKYRKPIPGMWKHFKKVIGILVNYKDSFYCGDACGRKGDYTQGDYLFAMNCKLSFKTPEELVGLKFKSDEEKRERLTPNASYIDFDKVHNYLRHDSKYPEPTTPAKNSMILMMGAPASGKSTYVNGLCEQSPFWESAVIISNDTHTKGQMKKKMEEAVKLKSPIIVDNTHSTKKQRQPFIEFAVENKYSIVVVHVKTCLQVAMHLNVWRMYKYDKPLIPFVAYATWNKNKEDIDEEKEAKYITEIVEYMPELSTSVMKFRANGFYKEVKRLDKLHLK